MPSDNMPLGEDDQFIDDYNRVIDESGKPNLSTIRRIVVDLLENPDTPPLNGDCWPLTMFIRQQLERNVPLNWLTNGVAVNTATLYHRMTRMIDRIDRDNGIFIELPLRRVDGGDDIIVEISDFPLFSGFVLPTYQHDLVSLILESTEIDADIERIVHIHVKHDKRRGYDVGFCLDEERG